MTSGVITLSSKSTLRMKKEKFSFRAIKMAESNRWDADLSHSSDNDVVSSSNIVLENVDHQSEYNILNNDILKSVFSDCWADWEDHRRICCLTQSQFAKHLLSFHQSNCTNIRQELANDEARDSGSPRWVNNSAKQLDHMILKNKYLFVLNFELNN